MCVWPSGIIIVREDTEQIHSVKKLEIEVGGYVALKWDPDNGGEYFGIVNSEGDLGLSQKPICELCVIVNSPSHSSGLCLDMKQSLVTSEGPGVVTLCRTFDDKTCCLTGHINSTVDGIVSITKYGQHDMYTVYFHFHYSCSHGFSRVEPPSQTFCPLLREFVWFVA